MKKEIVENFVKETSMRIPMQLQFFAEGDGSGESNEGSDDGDEGSNDEGQNDDANQGSKKTGDNKDGKKDKTFSQAQVSAMMADEKRQGKKSVYNELGLDEKTAKAQIEAFKKWQASQKTPEQIAAENNAQAEREKSELQAKLFKAEVKAEALKLGFKPEYVDDLVTLAAAKTESTEDVAKVLEGLKTRYPNFLESSGEDDDDDSNIGKKGTGSPVKHTGKKSTSGKDSVGSRLGATRVATETGKSSFF